MVRMTTTMTIKINKDLKLQAQQTAASLGIPLSTIINASLRQMVLTGRVEFIAAEPMTPKMEKIIGEAEREIAAGETSGPFDTVEEAIAYLNSLSPEDAD
jgi:addiction module RelB/DinJ family antitoxin